MPIHRSVRSGKNISYKIQRVLPPLVPPQAITLPKKSASYDRSSLFPSTSLLCKALAANTSLVDYYNMHSNLLLQINMTPFVQEYFSYLQKYYSLQTRSTYIRISKNSRSPQAFRETNNPFLKYVWLFERKVSKCNLKKAKIQN